MSGAIGAVAAQNQGQPVQDIAPKLEPVQVKPEYQPVESAEGAKAISEEALVKNIEYLNKILQAKDTNVSMQYDGLSSPKIVTIVDNETGKVIREMPPKAAVEIAEKAQAYLIGMLVDKSI